jgi:hypothetical protein
MSYQNGGRKRRVPSSIRLTSNRRSRNVRQWAIAGVIGLVAAFALPLVTGLLVKGTGGMEQAPDVLRAFSTVSVILMIPLLVFGSYCLNEAVERAYFRNLRAGRRDSCHSRVRRPA